MNARVAPSVALALFAFSLLVGAVPPSITAGTLALSAHSVLLAQNLLPCFTPAHMPSSL